MIRSAMLVLATFTIAGCAAPSGEVALSDTGNVCTKEMALGSVIPITRCRTPAQIEQERLGVDAARDAVRNKATQPGKSGN